MNNQNGTMSEQFALEQIHPHWGWFLALGITLITLGTLALFYAFTSTLISVLYLGGLLIAFGVLEGVKAFHLRTWGTFFLHLALALLYGAGGIFIIMYPTLNALTLTLLLAVFFVASGTLKIIFALARPLPHKGWVLFNGIITLLLGILIWMQWPYSGLWVLGTFLGIEMIFTGWTWVMLSLMAKDVRKA